MEASQRLEAVAHEEADRALVARIQATALQDDGGIVLGMPSQQFTQDQGGIPALVAQG